MTILAYNLGGLANRMKNIVSCFRLDPIVLVYWQNVENYDEKNYHSLLKNNGTSSSFEDLIKHKKGSKYKISVNSEDNEVKSYEIEVGTVCDCKEYNPKMALAVLKDAMPGAKLFSFQFQVD